MRGANIPTGSHNLAAVDKMERLVTSSGKFTSNLGLNYYWFCSSSGLRFQSEAFHEARPRTENSNANLLQQMFQIVE